MEGIPIILFLSENKFKVQVFPCSVRLEISFGIINKQINKFKAFSMTIIQVQVVVLILEGFVKQMRQMTLEIVLFGRLTAHC